MPAVALALALIPRTAIAATSEAGPAVTYSKVASAPAGYTARNVLAPAGLPACGKVATLLPPPGFNPLTATPSQLRANDFPAAPTDPVALHAWKGYVHLYVAGKARVVGNCPVPASEAHPIYSQQSPDAGANSWSGYIVDNKTYTNIEAQWVVPDAYSPPNTNSYHWIGIGLGSSASYPLVQAGSATTSSNVATTFIETYYPGNPVGIQPAGPSVSPGDFIYVHVTFNPNGAVGYHLINYNTGYDSYPTPDTYLGMAPDGHAEWITEAVSGLLADFNYIIFQEANVNTDGGAWVPLGSEPNYTTTMTDSAGNVMCYPWYFDGSQSFRNIWNASS